jgi:Ca2+-dependent lipid-binding protein
MICSFLVSAAALAMIKCQAVHKSLFAGDYHRIAYIFRSSIYSWQLSWITLIIWHVIGQSLVLIILTNMFEFGQNTIRKQSKLKWSIRTSASSSFIA